ncbi:hypothetical protein [Marivirga arenosa]|uniref:Uncharacterized protein n=1 Tax=Marivirga arenosa TaxID=3059076 RepID=A0AA49GEH4_9BACT|nr:MULTISPECIES: hypothetical protein [unclassified Marivirga]WKK85712.2 hypothetical protein QYS48_01000 [Marivirga sp. ABR2-2]WNB17600.1 hypothetical protein QYS47_34425 [Marivirga sp. BKB1-2]
MKKVFLALIAVFVVSSTSYASNTDLFTLNEEKINTEFKELNELEEFVAMNEDVTLNTVYSENSNLVAGMNLSYGAEGMMGHNGFSMDSFEWGSFAWGFCCFPIGAAIGVFTVLLNDNKGSDHKISYFIGAGLGFLFSGGLGTYYIGL